jgi:Coenzyme PQQ synthesis protein D (PqqD)
MAKMMNLQSSPQRKAQVISQKASNDFLLFNMDDGNYYSLNEVGSRIWELCDGNHTVAQLVTALQTEYDAPSETLQADVLEMLENLRSGELIFEASGLQSSGK